MEKVLDVYKEPYYAYFPVVCMDKSCKQLIEEGNLLLQLNQARVPEAAANNELQIQQLYARIGQLKVGNDFLKKLS
jgi:dephospho-CoA kinase